MKVERASCPFFKNALILGRGSVCRFGCADVLEDKGADVIKRAEVREDLKKDIGVCFPRCFNDMRDIIGHVDPAAEEVGEYFDFRSTRFDQAGDGGVNLRTGNFKKSMGRQIKGGSRVLADVFCHTANLVVRAFAAASVGDN